MPMLHAILLLLAVSALPEAQGSSIVRSDSQHDGKLYVSISDHGMPQNEDYVASADVAQQLVSADGTSQDVDAVPGADIAKQLVSRSGRTTPGDSVQDKQLFQVETNGSLASDWLQHWCNPIWAIPRFTCGITAVKGVVEKAQTDTAKTSGLVTQFEDALFLCVQESLEGTILHGHTDMTALEKKWDDAFEAMDTTGIEGAVKLYQQTGNVEELFGISEILIMEAIGTVKGFPDKTTTGEDIKSTKDAVVGYLTTVEGGTENLEKAMLSVIEKTGFDFLGDWVEVIMPTIAQCAGVVLGDLGAQIVQGLDTLIGQVVSIAADYMKRIAEAKFCWRLPGSKAREWTHPNICSGGWDFSFGQGCIKASALLLQDVDNAVSSKAKKDDVDKTAEGKNKPKPWECVPPNCRTPSCPDDREQGMRGHQVVCFAKDCPAYHEVSASKTDCKLLCPSSLPSETGAICAETVEVATSAITDMLVGTVTNIMDAVEKVVDLTTSKEFSDVKSKMPGTIDSLAKIGHAFAARPCLELHKER